MVGKYIVEIYNRRKHFSIEVKRRITIIKGKSGTGKSTLIRFIEQYQSLGKSSGIKCNTNADDILVLRENTDYEKEISKRIGTNTLIFADEEVSYIKSRDFINVLDDSGFYLIVISREVFRFFDYSVSEIYELITSIRGNVSYTTLSRKYKGNRFAIKPDVVISEDSNSGFEVVSKILKCLTVSANGKDNVIKLLDREKEKNDNICVIADGAAFGKNIEDILLWEGANTNKNLCIFIPESFEWVLLNTKPFKSKVLSEITDTYLYADTIRYKTWERYYFSLLKTICRAYPNVSYGKDNWGSLVKLYTNGLDGMLSEVSQYFENIDKECKNY